MITNIDAAEDAFNAAVADVEADHPELEEVEWHDIVVSIAWDMDAPTALELCRTKLGYVPHDLESWLGRRDFLEGVL